MDFTLDGLLFEGPLSHHHWNIIVVKSVDLAFLDVTRDRRGQGTACQLPLLQLVEFLHQVGPLAHPSLLPFLIFVEDAVGFPEDGVYRQFLGTALPSRYDLFVTSFEIEVKLGGYFLPFLAGLLVLVEGLVTVVLVVELQGLL